MMFGAGDYWSANDSIIVENETKAKKLFIISRLYN